MTPAEKLSSEKPWNRAPRNIKQPRFKRIWLCTARTERERLRLSMRDVAKAVKLSVTGLFQIEHGGDPQLSTATRLAAFFGKTVEQLWPRKSNEKPKTTKAHPQETQP